MGCLGEEYVIVLWLKQFLAIVAGCYFIISLAEEEKC